jgi:hypothetical protein
VDAIGARLEAQEQNDHVLLQLGHDTLTSGGNSLFAVDLLIIGAVKRTVSVSAGFRALVAGSNFLCSAALLRMNLETAARLFALWLVEDTDAHARAILAGTPLGQLKAADGKQLRDGYIVDKLTELHPWAKDVYAQASAFVHFTERHIFAAVSSTDEETRQLNFFVSDTDTHVSEVEWHELLDAFVASTRLVVFFIEAWRQTKVQAHARQAGSQSEEAV